MGGRNSRPIWRPPPPPPPPPMYSYHEINNLKSQINHVSNDNANKQSQIFNKQRDLSNRSRYYDGRLYNLGQEDDYYVGENRRLKVQSEDMDNIKAKLRQYLSLIWSQNGIRDNRLAAIDLNLNKAKVYQTIKNENDLMMETIPNMEIAYSSDTQKIEYEKKNISDLDTINTVLFYIYYVIICHFRNTAYFYK